MIYYYNSVKILIVEPSKYITKNLLSRKQGKVHCSVRILDSVTHILVYIIIIFISLVEYHSVHL